MWFLFLKAVDDFSNDALFETLKAYATERAIDRLCYVANPYRCF